MRKFIVLLIAAGLLTAVASAYAAPNRIWPSWKSVPVTIRTSTVTGDPNDQGWIDSSAVTLGALASIDTSAAISLEDMVLYADSLTYIRVEVIGNNAFASGESLYVTFDGSHAGVAFTDLGLATCGTCMVGGYGAAGSLVPGATTSASRIWNGAGSATAVHVAQASATAGPGRTTLYGNFGTFTTIRLRIKSDSAVVPVVNTVRFRLWYISAEDSR